jgi:hypothetical protein
MQGTRRAHKEKGWYAPHNVSLASCPSGRRSGWAVRRFDLLVLNEVPDVVLCLCAQGEGAFLRIAPQRYKSKEPPAKGFPRIHTFKNIHQILLYVRTYRVGLLYNL